MIGWNGFSARVSVGPDDVRPVASGGGSNGCSWRHALIHRKSAACSGSVESWWATASVQFLVRQVPRDNADQSHLPSSRSRFTLGHLDESIAWSPKFRLGRDGRLAAVTIAPEGDVYEPLLYSTSLLLQTRPNEYRSTGSRAHDVPRHRQLRPGTEAVRSSRRMPRKPRAAPQGASCGDELGEVVP